jgi:hypothetical protein
MQPVYQSMGEWHPRDATNETLKNRLEEGVKQTQIMRNGKAKDQEQDEGERQQREQATGQQKIKDTRQHTMDLKSSQLTMPEIRRVHLKRSKVDSPAPSLHV